MRQLYADIADFRSAHWSDPMRLLVAEQDWDIVVAGTYHYPADAKYSHEKVWHNPANHPGEGTILGIPARKDATVTPGRARLIGVGGQR
jgi:hypothetical protein